jgi:hypothetical protein
MVEDDDGDANADDALEDANYELDWKPKSPESSKGKIIICMGT